jgi:hypothetical protein
MSLSARNIPYSFLLHDSCSSRLCTYFLLKISVIGISGPLDNRLECFIRLRCCGTHPNQVHCSRHRTQQCDLAYLSYHFTLVAECRGQRNRVRDEVMKGYYDIGFVLGLLMLMVILQAIMNIHGIQEMGYEAVFEW